MSATSQRRDPFPVYCFRVDIQGIDGATAFFKSVGGLKSETEVVDFQEGGLNDRSHRLIGATKWSNLVFKRGFSQSRDLLIWREQWLFNKDRTRRNGTISQLNTKMDAVYVWQFEGGWPCKWELSEMDASKSELAIETLEIAHDGLYLITPQRIK